MGLSDFFRGIGDTAKSVAGGVRKSIFSDSLKTVLETAQTVANIKTTIDQIRGKRETGSNVYFAPPPPRDGAGPVKYGTRDEDRLYADRPRPRMSPALIVPSRGVDLAGPRTNLLAAGMAPSKSNAVIIVGGVVLVALLFFGGR